jgi:hypothetical protein
LAACFACRDASDARVGTDSPSGGATEVMQIVFCNCLEILKYVREVQPAYRTHPHHPLDNVWRLDDARPAARFRF